MMYFATRSISQLVNAVKLLSKIVKVCQTAVGIVGQLWALWYLQFEAQTWRARVRSSHSICVKVLAWGCSICQPWRGLGEADRVLHDLSQTATHSASSFESQCCQIVSNCQMLHSLHSATLLCAPIFGSQCLWTMANPIPNGISCWTALLWQTTSTLQSLSWDKEKTWSHHLRAAYHSECLSVCLSVCLCVCASCVPPNGRWSWKDSGHRNLNKLRHIRISGEILPWLMPQLGLGTMCIYTQTYIHIYIYIQYMCM